MALVSVNQDVYDAMHELFTGTGIVAYLTNGESDEPDASDVNVIATWVYVGAGEITNTLEISSSGGVLTFSFDDATASGSYTPSHVVFSDTVTALANTTVSGSAITSGQTIAMADITLTFSVS